MVGGYLDLVKGEDEILCSHIIVSEIELLHNSPRHKFH